MRSPATPILSLPFVALLSACAAATPTESTTPAATTSVRSIDWATVAYPPLDLRAGDELGPPEYVDLTGDGVEDAVLEGMSFTPGSGSYTTYLFVFTVPQRASEPVLLATIVGGDRADGAIRLMRADATGLHLARAILGPATRCAAPAPSSMSDGCGRAASSPRIPLSAAWYPRNRSRAALKAVQST